MAIPLDSISPDRRPEVSDLAALAECRSCGHQGLAPFYEVRAVPVHSVSLLATRSEAMAYPTGDVVLGFCPHCGFIQNMVYDATVQDYSRDYEETQAFSPRFLEFADSLVDRLVTTYQLRKRVILEVGGGKGDFLARLCEAGENLGIGIDPAYVPGRLESPGLERITFHREFFSKDHTYLTGDLVCCRHTLEHIGPVREFASLLATSVGHTPGSVLFLEVPETLRVLRERAFWDIYYEHCSYFTRGSLSRLIAGLGLTVTYLELGFEDQYVLCDATRGAETGIVVDDLDVIAGEVEDFARHCGAVIETWRERFRRAAAENRRVVLWGAGSKAVAFLNTLGTETGVEFAVDINPHKHGTFLAGTGQECVAPEFLIDYQPDLVVAMNPVYVEEIRGSLIGLGLDPELVAV